MRHLARAAEPLEVRARDVELVLGAAIHRITFGRPIGVDRAPEGVARLRRQHARSVEHRHDASGGRDGCERLQELERAELRIGRGCRALLPKAQ